ncbi:MAG: hypothetical protein QW165_05245 [Candidatus Woesearchaeota archaeon]
MAPQEGPSDAEIQKLKKEKQQAEEAAKKAKLAAAATFVPGAQVAAPMLSAGAKAAESRAESAAAQLKRAEEERRAAEERKRQEEQRQQVPASAPTVAMGITGKVGGGIWRGAKKVFGAVLPEGVAEHGIRAVFILGAAFAFYLLFKRLGIRTPFNISIVLILGIIAAVYELAPGPIGKFFRWVALLFGGLIGFWALAMAPFSPHVAKWAILVWLIMYTALFFSILGARKGLGVLMFNALIFGLLFTGFYNGMFQPETPLYVALQGQQSAWKELYGDIRGAGEEVAVGFKRTFFSSIGDYELGIEENRERPLGVYLADVGVASEQVSLDGTVQVFATLRSLSFKTDKDLEITLDCYEEGKQDMPDKHGTITPQAKYLLAAEQERPVNCNIDATDLGPGSHTISLEATFEFPTSAFVKTYFMEQGSIRSYKQQHPEEGSNPLDEFGITDKSPVAVFTGGPLYIGMGTGAQPIALPETENYGPTLTVTLDRNAGWSDGELLSVQKFMVSAPTGLKITRIAGRPVEQYCRVQNGEDTCVLDNPEILNHLFPPIEKPIRLKKNIRVETMIADRAALMANAPMSMRSFKVTVDYTYRIKKSASVIVRELGKVGGSST